ncbi:MAG: hypothetical protein ABIP79_00060 [Chitinophagaceae bacterium]
MRQVLIIILLGVLLFISCQKEFSYEGGIKNIPPIAKAGKDAFITLPTDSTLLDGSNSTDPDGTISSFLWKKISGPATFVIANITSAKTNAKSLVTGIYQFELKVTDNGGLSGKDTMMVTVDAVPTNHPPVAIAGSDTTLILPVNAALLNGSASFDPDNNITSYLWTKISGPAAGNISNASAIQTQINNLVLGIYFFDLKVTDAGGLFSRDTVKITVRLVPNKPPIANAGTDITVTYNLQSCMMEPSFINLDGRASYDPDGTIDVYQWTLISTDNASPIILNSNSAFALINNLVPGNFIFRLQVTDNDGATDDDTVNVNTVYTSRPEINARLVPVGNLSQSRTVSTVATANGKILFAGGLAPATGTPAPPGPNYSSRVDIFDIASGTWSTAELSMPRSDITSISLGNNIYFAGGSNRGPTTRVDVYDSSRDLWTTMEMRQPGSKLASLAFGNKLFIAGGDYLNIFDGQTKGWSAKKLSQYRHSITALSYRGILYFMGGVQSSYNGILSSRIDVYDPVANTLSTDELSEPKFGMIASGKIMAGGTTEKGMINSVEGIGGCLFQPNSFSHHSYGKLGNKIVFFIWDGKAKNRFDIFDLTTSIWSIGVLDQAITPSLIISVNNTIYVTGDYGNTNGYYKQVWKLEF